MKNFNRWNWGGWFVLQILIWGMFALSPGTVAFLIWCGFLVAAFLAYEVWLDHKNMSAYRQRYISRGWNPDDVIPSLWDKIRRR